MELRYYQQAAVSSVWDHLRKFDTNPCVVIPTAGGKTPVIATLVRDAVEWGGRVLILAHVKELLEQTASKLEAVCPGVRYGIYSAGLKKRDRVQSVIVASIQSIYKKSDEFFPFDLVIVDEAHLIPANGQGMYQTFLAEQKKLNPNVRVIGLTATPYRLGDGEICGPKNILNEVCYEISVRKLIDEGFISKLSNKAGTSRIDFSKLKVRAGEYAEDDLQDAMSDEKIVADSCEEIVKAARERNSVLIFASGVSHGQLIANELLTSHGITADFVVGDTESDERRSILDRFKSRQTKFLVNVNVLTTGFDATGIDMVALLRPTLSPGLYYQMVGRGFRLHEGKTDCLVLDFGGNIVRHGPIDRIAILPKKGKGKSSAPGKECPDCHEVVGTATKICPACGHVWAAPEKVTVRHEPKADGESELVSDGKTKKETHAVIREIWSIHTKAKAPPGHPRTLRVDYEIGFHQFVSEWVCFEHKGFARKKAEKWWQKRSRTPVPITIEEALKMRNWKGEVAKTLGIEIKHKPDSRFPEIVGYDVEPLPPIEPTKWSDLFPKTEPEPCLESIFGTEDSTLDEEVPF